MSAQTSVTNPYEGGTPWETRTGRLLEDGDFVVTIQEAEDGTSQSQKPIIKIRFANEQGSIGHRLPYSGEFPDKLLAIAKAAGVPYPKDGEFDPDDHFRVTPQWISRLVNKRVGIVVRPELNERDNKTYQAVKGYVRPEEISGGQAQASASKSSSSGSSDDDIPF